MKIKDLITLEKGYGDRYMNGKEKKYFDKNGYFWKIPSHSANEGVLLNNYEKDCVVACVRNKYFVIFLIKINSNNYRGFCYLKGFLKDVAGSYSYAINDISDNRGMLDLFDKEEEDLIINEEKEYRRFKKLLVLKGMDL